MPQFGAMLEGVVHPGDGEREVSPAVDGDYPQPGVTVEDAAEDHPGQRHGRSERHPDDVDQVVITEPGRLRVAGGVEEDRQPAPRQRLPYEFQVTIVEIDSVGVGPQFDPAQTQVHHPTDLGHRRWGVGQGKRAQPEEPVWVRLDHGGDALVLRRGQPGSQVGIEPVGVLHR